MPFSNLFRRPKKDKPPLTSIRPVTYEANNLPTTKNASTNGRNTNGNTSAPVVKQNLLFHAQLSHGSPTVKVGDFTSVRELYVKIADAFKISSDEIIFCTLNTHKCDMDRLLGAQIGLEDFIFAHIKGERKQVTLTKTEPALGLTITDNGAGYPFVKRLKENSIAANCGSIFVGDHIESIGDQVTVGRRHFHVAKLLKDMELGTTFTITLVEPQKAFDMISQRNSGKSSVSSSKLGTGKSTLRLRSKGPATVEEMPSETEDKAVRRIDDLLENFLGIRDMELASTIWESGRDKKNSDEFATSVNEQLGDFGFPDELLFDVWGIVLDARK